MDAHDLVALVKQLNQDLGRKPNLNQFLAAGGKDLQMRKMFGSYSNLIKAAGLQPYRDDDAAPNIPQLPDEPLREQIETHIPREFKTKKENRTILVIGDTHFPFVHTECLQAIFDFNKEHKPDYIVQVGDLYDLYAHSKFPRSLNTHTPQEEERLAREGAENMWVQLILDNSKAKCFQLLGNHDARPVKRVLELAAGFEHVIKKHYTEMMQFDGVETIDDYRQELIIDNIIFHHGYRSQLGSHRDFVRQNFVCGHSHKGGVVFRKMREETIWELNAGFVGDADSKALSYTAQKMNDQTLGWGYIDEHGPRFIPF